MPNNQIWSKKYCNNFTILHDSNVHPFMLFVVFCNRYQLNIIIYSEIIPSNNEYFDLDMQLLRDNVISAVLDTNMQLLMEFCTRWRLSSCFGDVECWIITVLIGLSPDSDACTGPCQVVDDAKHQFETVPHDVGSRKSHIDGFNKRLQKKC